MQDIEKQYVRTFATNCGKQVLAHLRSLTIERIVGPNVSNEDLRWWAAQNALIHHIENMIKKGNNPT
ncbi:MAG: hypothetical protein IJL05_00255 [Alphaproteobacteria bacterium]|nr:hypothetical protein [Alphaproteobacteria bacterium]